MTEAAGERRGRPKYWVKLMVLAVGSADGCHSTAARYAAAAGDERLPARFTIAAAHDLCLDPLPWAVQAAEEKTMVSTMVVMCRGSSVEYPNERLSGGSWGCSAGTVRTLQAGPHRPHTELEALKLEASWFLAGSVHRDLGEATPQYWPLPHPSGPER